MLLMSVLLLLCAVLQLVCYTEAFIQTAHAAAASKFPTRPCVTSTAATKKGSDSNSAAADVFGKATWAGAEALGNVAAAFRKKGL
jgi:hypothetical protein